MIVYTNSLTDVTAEHLVGGFFVGWPHPPSPADHLRLLRQSTAALLARRADGLVVGFITAISDEVSCAYIPHLEVLPEYQGQGIGSELVKHLLARFQHLYMIDLLCDAELQPFYARLGMRPITGMLVRNFDHQSCEPLSLPPEPGERP
ncbi:MAG: GNAT family N-acetyltransferase [Herpetosiphonaceae bacterium]|nr:GNAT family N-acetyltransferase [Herpetosiphonaceae bacterium]